MQHEFLMDRTRAQVGQKVDSTSATVVSVTSNSEVFFGSLLLYDDKDAISGKLPTPDGLLDKPIGIALRQNHSLSYQPKSLIAVLRQGRVWVYAQKVNSPGDEVFIKFLTNGAHRFSGDKADSIRLLGAVFLEKCEDGLVPIEVNFLGGGK